MCWGRSVSQRNMSLVCCWRHGDVLKKRETVRREVNRPGTRRKILSSAESRAPVDANGLRRSVAFERDDPGAGPSSGRGC
jgi:hypothetical protein